MASGEDHEFSEENEKNSQKILKFVGNDTDSWHKNNWSGQMQVRNADSVQERADELQHLSIAAAQNEVEDWATGILPQLIKILKCSLFLAEVENYSRDFKIACEFHTDSWT